MFSSIKYLMSQEFLYIFGLICGDSKTNDSISFSLIFLDDLKIAAPPLMQGKEFFPRLVNPVKDIVSRLRRIN